METKKIIDGSDINCEHLKNNNSMIIELFHAFYNGDQQAKEKIITSYLNLVIYIARRYANSLLCLDDLIQEGNIGLIKAVENFNLDISDNFYNYAIYWIEKYIIEYINKTNLIVLPYNIRYKLNKILQLQDQLKSENEICQQLAISHDEYKKIISYQYFQQQLRDDLISEDISNDLIFEDMVEDLLNALKDEKDREIVRLYLGFEGQCFTFQQIADIYGCSKIAIYKRYQKAIKIIREYYDKQKD